MKPPLYIKELLALIQLKCLNKNYMKLIGRKLKRIKTLMKLTKFFYKKSDHYTITFFQKKKIAISKKDLKGPWITTGIKKSSKRKQRLYKKNFLNRNSRNDSEYKNHKKLFELVKGWSKKLYYSNLILKYKNNLKRTWDVIMDSIGKAKSIK